jgi:hypothetical protein
MHGFAEIIRPGGLLSTHHSETLIPVTVMHHNDSNIFRNKRLVDVFIIARYSGVSRQEFQQLIMGVYPIKGISLLYLALRWVC